MRNLTSNVVFQRISSQIAAGSTVHNMTAVDMAGYDGVTFLVNLGAFTTGTVVNAHIEMSSSSGGTYSDIAGSAANALSTEYSDDSWLITETWRPQQRWVRCVVDRASANAVINSVLALKFPAMEMAVTQTTAGIHDITLTVSASSGSAT